MWWSNLWALSCLLFFFGFDQLIVFDHLIIIKEWFLIPYEHDICSNVIMYIMFCVMLYGVLPNISAVDRDLVLSREEYQISKKVILVILVFFLRKNEIKLLCFRRKSCTFNCKFRRWSSHGIEIFKIEQSHL